MARTDEFVRFWFDCQFLRCTSFLLYKFQSIYLAAASCEYGTEKEDREINNGARRRIMVSNESDAEKNESCWCRFHRASNPVSIIQLVCCHAANEHIVSIHPSIDPTNNATQPTAISSTYHLASPVLGIRVEDELRIVRE